MTGWTAPEPDRRPQRRSFAADVMGLGPASTPGRDIVIAILTIALVSALLFLVFPDRWMIIGALGAYHVLRFLTGIPKWSRRR